MGGYSCSFRDAHTDRSHPVPSTCSTTPRRARCLLLASLVLLVATAQAEQTARPNAPPLARPAYESGKGPVVAIDEAHRNTHTFTAPPFRGFVELLQLDGY